MYIYLNYTYILNNLKVIMLFNSHLFIFLFLPLTLTIFHLLSKYKLKKFKLDFLIFASLFFYSWWNPKYLFLLLGSILFNYIIGKVIASSRSKFKLVFGILFNLFIIGYYKYSNFFLENINVILEKNNVLETIILPLGISYFTFQQITYLVDCFLGKVSKHNLKRYFLYVSFFPQIISGPIIRHDFMMPQIVNEINKDFNINNLNIGLTTFIIGLFKKVVIADNLALYANPVFNLAESGYVLNFFDAWAGALTYTFQIYFDFSGYMDMALGIGIMFGIVLPINFFSPFKAKNISEFWMCWHVTLSNLARNYLYFPLSIFFSRKAIENNYGTYKFFFLSLIVPTLISFSLIGLWHGAAWNFIIFGVINGFYIIIYNLWVATKKKYKISEKTSFIKNLISQFITFISIVIALIFFRAQNLEGSWNFIKSIFGFGNFDLLNIFQIGIFALKPYTGITWLVLCSIIVFLMPNTQESVFQSAKNDFNKQNMLRKKKSIINFKWKPNLLWLTISLILFVFSILSLNNESEFIYLQF